ncbi:RICIN domain-containing protein [Sphingomonas sp. CJ99]
MTGSISLRQIAGIVMAALIASIFASSAAMAQQGVRIENRWKPDMAVESRNSPVRVAPIGPEYVESHWTFVKQGNNAYFIVHQATNLVLTAAARPTLKPFNNTDTSQVWIVENVGGFYRIRPGANAFAGQALHIERGVLEVGAVEPGWWSAHWTLRNFNPNVSVAMPQAAVGAQAVAARQQSAPRYYRVVNRYNQQQVLDWVNPTVGTSALGATEWKSLWVFIPITVQTANGPKEAFTIQTFSKSEVISGETRPMLRPVNSQNPDPRTLWFVEQSGKFVRIRNVAAPDRYLNIEPGSLDYGAIQPGWWSADWILEPYDPETTARLINTREAANPQPQPKPPATATPAVAGPTQAARYYRVVNRYNQQHVLDWVNPTVGTSAQGPTDWKSLWVFIPITVQIANGPKEAFTIQTFSKPQVISGEAQPMLRPMNAQNPDPRALWFVEQSGKFVRIRNVAAPDRYLNIEPGRLEYGAIQPGWWSADWILEPYDPDATARIINERDAAANP